MRDARRRLAIVLVVTAAFACGDGGGRDAPVREIPAAADAGTTDTVRLLIYNVRHGAGMHTDSVDLGRAAAVIRRVDPDLVLLQEIDRGAARTGGVDQAAALARLSGLPHHAFGPFMEYDGGQYGMAAISRWPILRQENHVLPPGTEPRTALEIVVRAGGNAEGGLVRAVGIHLYETEPQRLDQARTLVELFAGGGDAAGGAGAPILAGDFNSRRYGTVMTLLEKDWHVVPKPDGAHATFPADVPEREIDYFLVPPDGPYAVLSQQVVEETSASDHRPVVLEIAIRR